MKKKDETIQRSGMTASKAREINFHCSIERGDSVAEILEKAIKKEGAKRYLECHEKAQVLVDLIKGKLSMMEESVRECSGRGSHTSRVALKECKEALAQWDMGND